MSRTVVIPRFQVIRRGEVIRVVPLHRNQLVIGSEDGAHLRLKHPAIAPRHLEINVVDGRFLEAANLAGEGRVLLGNQPMNKARLREGDELDLGPVSLRLTYQRSDKTSDRMNALAKPVPGATPDDTDDEPTVDDMPVPKLPERAPAATAVPTAAAMRAVEQEATVVGAAHGIEEEATVAGDLPPTAIPVDPIAAAGVDVDLDDIVLDPTPIVVIEPPGGRPQRVPLRVGSFVVGAGRCAFRLSYPGVAPAHAEMMVMPDGAVYLKHLAGSGLLTLRNGAPIQFSRWTAGDRLQVGPVSMRLELEPAASAVSSIPTRVKGEPAAAPLAAAAPAPPPPPAAKPLPPDKPHAPKAPRPTPVRHPSGSQRLPSMTPAPGARTPTPPPMPAPVAAPPPAKPPLVKRNTGRFKKQPGLVKRNTASNRKPPSRKLEQAGSPLVRTNTVSVSLDVTTQETMQALYFDDDVEYTRPCFQRALLPTIVILLLIAIGLQVGLQLGLFGGSSGNVAGTARTATGASGLDAGVNGAIGGDGTITIGDPTEDLGARRARAGSSGYDYGGPGNIDWEDNRTGRMVIRGGAYSTDHDGKGIDARTAEDIERNRPRPSVDIERDASVDAPETSGGSGNGFVKMKDVEKVIYDNGRKLKYCYTQARQDDRKLEGLMWLTLTLATDGRIRGVVAEPRSTLKSEALRSCLERQLYSLSMPKPTGGPVTFSYPFEFRASE
ncbi:MAG: AgmX/PglI C-terminal domain-containing protein [Proteobacteria bacterium]|nr:AgmX/PglI C-terminal domain-containing protein [Pseudomonadota bacterium]